MSITRRVLPRSSQRGQTILEVLIAILVVGLVMVALASMLTMSVKNTAEGKYRNLATSQAQEALEVFRRERVRLGWNAFKTAATGGLFCLNTLPSSSDNLTTFLAQNSDECEASYVVSNSNFTRQVEIQHAADEVVLIVTVGWLDGNQPREVILEQEFREYQQ